ncbi:hypothetical protein KAK06_15120 [Ideonella sp. 4Y11]|uniref:Uncharacterized protein n=1 Tax=Ideonella aquatica TaxID=2824119 RepID=A0A941BM02_9BURK|nr:hypothetical protein [Ideonella aquatica]MBQ0960284.1 hypothetical protein [Ideonella aquatica]
MPLTQWIAAAALAALAGSAQAAPWRLPSAITIDGYCDVFTNLVYVGPANGNGWYTGRYDASACGITPTMPASGPQARKLLAFDGSGVALSVDTQGTTGSDFAFVLVLNSDQTWRAYDLTGLDFDFGTWTDATQAAPTTGARPMLGARLPR